MKSLETDSDIKVIDNDLTLSHFDNTNVNMGAHVPSGIPGKFNLFSNKGQNRETLFINFTVP